MTAAATKTGAIIHPPKTPLIMIRQEYLVLCCGDECAAALLNILERWNDNETVQAERDGWIYHSYPDFAEDALFCFSRQSVINALEKMVIDIDNDDPNYKPGWGFVYRRKNPNRKNDNSYHYKLNTVKINACLGFWYAAKFAEAGLKIDDANLNLDGGSLNLDGGRSKNRRTIQQNQTESESDQESEDTHTPEPTTDFSKLQKAFEQIKAGTITPKDPDLMQTDLDAYGLGACLAAVEKSAKHHPGTWDYVHTVLGNNSPSHQDEPETPAQESTEKPVPSHAEVVPFVPRNRPEWEQYKISPPDAWLATQSELKTSYPHLAIWFNDTSFYDYDGQAFTFAVSSQYLKDLLEKTKDARPIKTLQSFFGQGEIQVVRFILKSEAANLPDTPWLGSVSTDTGEPGKIKFDPTKVQVVGNASASARLRAIDIAQQLFFNDFWDGVLPIQIKGASAIFDEIRGQGMDLGQLVIAQADGQVMVSLPEELAVSA